MITISYAITACNEIEELKRLMSKLSSVENDEIVIQLDTSATDEVKQFVDTLENVKVVSFPLNNDFATFKNNLNSECTKDFIFQLDADEYPHQFLLENLHIILDSNEIDLLLVPRINMVNGLTNAHIRKWGWIVDAEGRVNFPDYQWRVYRNHPDIKWEGKVHEIITGYKSYAKLPASTEFCLYHIKEIERQEQQNERYSKIVR